VSIRNKAQIAAVAAIVTGSLLAGGSANAAGYSISLVDPAPTTTSGEAFKVTAGGGNREFVSVAVSCSDGGTVVYGTVLTVEAPAKGAGTSQQIYPPQGTCTADLVKLMQIGKSRVLASVSFTVSP